MRTMSSRLYRYLHSSEPGPTFGFAFYPIFGVPEQWSHITYMSALKYYRKTNVGKEAKTTKLEAFFINYYNVIIIDGLTIITES
jgi:hypothetical protein